MSEEAVKIAVLEQRIMDFANVMSKIDDAITKLSDVNANITKMLAVHEERIEQCNKSDDLLIKMIDNLKDENTREHKEVTDRIDEIEKKIEDVAKFRWMAAGVLAVLIFAAPLITNYTNNFIHQSQQHKIK
jgi:tetrahydromethanopterin S-methyltransferase subunit G